MRAVRLSLSFVAIGFLGGAAWVFSGPKATSQPATPTSSTPITAWPVTQFALRGTGSCTASACHNNFDGHGITGREYAIFANDKHSNAYSVLLDDRSKKIEQRLHSSEISDWTKAEPERDLLCLRCHVHPNVKEQPMHVADGVRAFRFEDGVSCESCHGPAEKWLAAHHTPDWKSLSPEVKRDVYGMEDLRPIENRVKVCLACHVGTANADVNHDLLAAGHPRLAFEFSSYHALMPRHWPDENDRDAALGGTPEFEARAWLVGQLLTLRASLELTKNRLERNKSISAESPKANDPKKWHAPWPELAEFNCYACHHDLTFFDKQDRAFTGKKPGNLTGNLWWTAETLHAVRLVTGKNVPNIEQGLVKIADLMKANHPNEEETLQTVDKLLAELRKLPTQPAVAPDVNAAMALIAGNRSAKNDSLTWDEAAQAYNGLVAFERTRIDRGLPRNLIVRENLSSLHDSLIRNRYRIPGDVSKMFRAIESSQLPTK